MAKIQNVGVGNYIRNPRGNRGLNSQQMNVEALRIDSNQGNSFLCFPVTAMNSGSPVVDTTRYLQIPIDTEVEQVFP